MVTVVVGVKKYIYVCVCMYVCSQVTYQSDVGMKLIVETCFSPFPGVLTYTVLFLKYIPTLPINPLSLQKLHTIMCIYIQ